MNQGQNGNDDGYYPSFNSMNSNGQDGNNNNTHPPPSFNNRGHNGNFNANLNFPYQMQQFYPQQSYMQQQNYEDNFNPAAAQQHNQFAFNSRLAGTDVVSSSRRRNFPFHHRSLDTATRQSANRTAFTHRTNSSLLLHPTHP